MDWVIGDWIVLSGGREGQWWRESRETDKGLCGAVTGCSGGQGPADRVVKGHSGAPDWKRVVGAGSQETWRWAQQVTHGDWAGRTSDVQTTDVGLFKKHWRQDAIFFRFPDRSFWSIVFCINTIHIFSSQQPTHTSWTRSLVIYYFWYIIFDNLYSIWSEAVLCHYNDITSSVNSGQFSNSLSWNHLWVKIRADYICTSVSKNS